MHKSNVHQIYVTKFSIIQIMLKCCTAEQSLFRNATFYFPGVYIISAQTICTPGPGLHKTEISRTTTLSQPVEKIRINTYELGRGQVHLLLLLLLQLLPDTVILRNDTFLGSSDSPVHFEILTDPGQ